jgi:hypothetical protein
MRERLLGGVKKRFPFFFYAGGYLFPSLLSSFPTYQCKKIGVRPFKQTNMVSKSSMTFESVNNKHQRPEAPSPFII